LKRWDKRPFEIRNLFNPAFCGLVLFRALAAFEEEDRRGMPYSLSLLVLPLCLQRDSREILAQSNRSYFLKIITANPQMLVDFPSRVTALLPFTQEALGFLMQLGSIVVEADGRLKTVQEGVRKTPSGTAETVACQRVAKYLGKEFARIGDRVTTYTTLGIRP
jgi:Family of unknown function (DUF6521)